MRRVAKTWLFLAFFSLPTLLPAQGLEDFYVFMSDLFGIDPNAGSYTFLLLRVPMGGRFESMATAYTAMAKDASYIESNPAASALLPDTELSLFHNNWISDTRLEGGVFTFRFDDWGFGLGLKHLYLPFTAIDNWGERYSQSWSDSFARGYYSESLVTLNTSYNFFRNFYFQGFTLGGNLKIAYRHLPDDIYRNQSALSIMADFGIMTRLSFLKFYYSREPNLSFGYQLRNIGLPVMGDPLPASMSLGMAYSPIRPLTVSLEGVIPLYLAEGFTFGDLIGINFGNSRAERPYAALGMDLVFTDFFSLQAGILAKLGQPRLNAGATLAVEKMILTFSYTLDLAETLSPLNRVSLAVRFNLGDLGRRMLQDQARELYLNGLEQYALGNLEQAIADFAAALEQDPTFTPAQEMLDTTRRALFLQQEMERLQIIE